VSSHA
jgi:hypothetical protein